MPRPHLLRTMLQAALVRRQINGPLRPSSPLRSQAPCGEHEKAAKIMPPLGPAFRGPGVRGMQGRSLQACR